MNAPVRFRVGGNFTYPPLTLTRDEFARIDSVVFVAGGVGINPIMSMLSAMDSQGADRLGGMPKRIRLLYSSKRGTDKHGKTEEILFEKRLQALAQKWIQKEAADFKCVFCETSATSTDKVKADGEPLPSNMVVLRRRLSHDDLFEALGPVDNRENALAYICGLPAMTDDFVEILKEASGMEEKRVLCEKWW